MIYTTNYNDMKHAEQTSTQQPVINRYLETVTGIHSQLLSRYAIGYLVRGTKQVCNGDKCQTIRKGEVFYFGLGYHHVENIPENGQSFELIYLLLTQENPALKGVILGNVDTDKKLFEQVIYEHIFRDISIEELSRLTNRSLTSFKKEFRRHFEFPPHKWFIRQCLMHLRLLLISTSKSISEIGNECSFPNTSHFIKLFKNIYGMTPATYRSRHLKSENVKNEVRNLQINIVV